MYGLFFPIKSQQITTPPGTNLYGVFENGSEPATMDPQDVLGLSLRDRPCYDEFSLCHIQKVLSRTTEYTQTATESPCLRLTKRPKNQGMKDKALACLRCPGPQASIRVSVTPWPRYFCKSIVIQMGGVCHTHRRCKHCFQPATGHTFE